ncbi:hypothetical protein B0H16DRAFT_1772892 [Mycena metata]|uniref:Uncharacterized protein n=1 Tax=Mycena metata TaxID=1033252 RepID=A0AAD7HZA1_9AGAR|nr:hypothetical protein B0H16DRAFT_1772892 [Mycena metata]
MVSWLYENLKRRAAAPLESSTISILMLTRNDCLIARRRSHGVQCNEGDTGGNTAMPRLSNSGNLIKAVPHALKMPTSLAVKPFRSVAVGFGPASGGAGPDKTSGCVCERSIHSGAARIVQLVAHLVLPLSPARFTHGDSHRSGILATKYRTWSKQNTRNAHDVTNQAVDVEKLLPPTIPPTGAGPRRLKVPGTLVMQKYSESSLDVAVSPSSLYRLAKSIFRGEDQSIEPHLTVPILHCQLESMVRQTSGGFSLDLSYGPGESSEFYHKEMGAVKNLCFIPPAGSLERRREWLRPSRVTTRTGDSALVLVVTRRWWDSAKPRSTSLNVGYTPISRTRSAITTESGTYALRPSLDQAAKNVVGPAASKSTTQWTSAASVSPAQRSGSGA